MTSVHNKYIKCSVYAVLTLIQIIVARLVTMYSKHILHTKLRTLFHYCYVYNIRMYVHVVCSTPFNGQVDCGSGLVKTAVEGDNCTFSCDPGYMLQGSVTSGSCENTGSWSGGLPSCVPLNCSEDNLPVPANATVLQLPSCGLAYQSQCTVSCDEGFSGDDITYLCNVTSDPTMVDWVPISNIQKNHTCQRGLLLHYMHLHLVNTMCRYVAADIQTVKHIISYRYSSA